MNIKNADNIKQWCLISNIAHALIDTKNWNNPVICNIIAMMYSVMNTALFLYRLSKIYISQINVWLFFVLCIYNSVSVTFQLTTMKHYNYHKYRKKIKRHVHQLLTYRMILSGTLKSYFIINHTTEHIWIWFTNRQISITQYMSGISGYHS